MTQEQQELLFQQKVDHEIKIEARDWMPDEYRKFKEMNTFWKKTMNSCATRPS